MIQGSMSTVHLSRDLRGSIQNAASFAIVIAEFHFCVQCLPILTRSNCTKMQRLAAFDALCLEFVELRPIEFPFILHHQFSQWSFLVLLKGGIGSIVSTIWEYWHYIPIAKRLENPYHLLSEASAPMRRIFLARALQVWHPFRYGRVAT